MQDHYTISELTREFGVSTRTLRFYEDEGLVRPVRRGRARLYRPFDRHLVRQILRGRRLGLSVGVLRDMVEVFQAPCGNAAHLDRVIERIEEHRTQLRQMRRDVEDALAELDRAEEACVERLAELGVKT